MSVAPIITFKAGLCELDTSSTPPRVKPQSEPGYIYLYSEDEFMHFCWRARSAPPDSPSLDLLMIPTDGSFTPYELLPSHTTSTNKNPTNGRIYVLKFTSSSQRHLFWLQSKSQHETNDPAFFSARDLKLGQIVNALLQGEEIDVQQAIASLPSDHNQDDGGNDDDATMEDIGGPNPDQDQVQGPSGGAGADATGGDVREEGQGSREGGADGGRAANNGLTDASSIVQNFLQSIGDLQSTQAQVESDPFTTLNELLSLSTTLPYIEAANSNTIDRLLESLPPNVLVLAQSQTELGGSALEHTSVEGAEPRFTLQEKKAVIIRILRSPQFSQALTGLTVALRDGGLPSISEALDIKVENGGYLSGGRVSLGGGNAVEAFVKGIKSLVQRIRSDLDGRTDETSG